MGRKKAIASGDGDSKDDAPDGSINAAMSNLGSLLSGSAGPAQLTALTAPVTVPPLKATPSLGGPLGGAFPVLSGLTAATAAASPGQINLGPIIGAPVLSAQQRSGSVALAFRKKEADGQPAVIAAPKIAMPVPQTTSVDAGGGAAVPKVSLPVPGAGGASLLAGATGLGALGGGAGGLNLAAMAGLNPLAAASAFGSPAMKQMAALAALSPDLLGMGAAAPKAPEPEKPKEDPKERLGVSYLNDPDILELFDHFQIDSRHMMRFCRAMQRRHEQNGTFEGDMLKIWEMCEQARNPEAMLVSKFHELEQGTFIGYTVPDAKLLALQKKYSLDKEALSKLTDVMAKHGEERRDQYLHQLEDHLAASSKPSAMVMMCLKKIAENQELGKPGRIAPGSFLAKQQAAEKGDKGGGRGGRSRSRGRGRRSPDRDRGGRYEDRRRGSPDRRRDRDDDRRDRDYGRGGGGRGRDDHDRDRRDDRRDYDRDRRDDRRGGGGGGGDGGAEQGDL